MLYACVLVSLTALLFYKKFFKRRYRSIGSQTPLKALTNRGVQTVEYCLYGGSDSDSGVGMDIVSTYFGYANADSDSFFSVLAEYSDNEHETSNQSSDSTKQP
jgi:hypothetical protein